MREVAESALVAAKLLPVIQKAIPRYSVQDVVPSELRVVHFLYKSRQNVQFTMPEFSACVGGEGRGEGEVGEGGDEGGALGEGGGGEVVCDWGRNFLSVITGTFGVI